MFWIENNNNPVFPSPIIIITQGEFTGGLTLIRFLMPGHCCHWEFQFHYRPSGRSQFIYIDGRMSLSTGAGAAAAGSGRRCAVADADQFLWGAA